MNSIPTSFDQYNRLIDPSNDIYPPPLMTKAEPRLVHGTDRLFFALWYLEVERVKQILNEHPEWINASDVYTPTPLHQLAMGTMVSNRSFHKSKYLHKFVKLTKLFLFNGADVTILDDHTKRTCGEEAVRFQNYWFLQLLHRYNKLEESLGSNKCPICFEKWATLLSKNNELFPYNCRHVICVECRGKNPSNICPICRYEDKMNRYKVIQCYRIIKRI